MHRFERHGLEFAVARTVELDGEAQAVGVVQGTGHRGGSPRGGRGQPRPLEWMGHAPKAPCGTVPTRSGSRPCAGLRNHESLKINRLGGIPGFVRLDTRVDVHAHSHTMRTSPRATKDPTNRFEFGLPPTYGVVPPRVEYPRVPGPICKKPASAGFLFYRGGACVRRPFAAFTMSVMRLTLRAPFLTSSASARG